MPALDWLLLNKEWIFSGIGLVVIAAAARVAWAIMQKTGLRRQSVPPRRLSPFRPWRIQASSRGTGDAPLELEDLLSQVERLPFVQREAAWSHYLGLRVIANGELCSVESVRSNRLRVKISMLSHDSDVWFDVPREQYPRLATANNGSKLTAVGILAQARPDLELHNAAILHIA